MTKKIPFKGLRRYWKAYGGWAAILGSPYFRRCLFPVILLFPLWLLPLQGPYIWVDLALAIIPALLSFSLAALAILLSMPSGQFFKILTDSEGGDSFYMAVSSTFTHFILVQIWTLLTIGLALAFPYPGTSGLGFFSFCYSLSCGLAAVSTLMSYANLRNEAAELED